MNDETASLLIRTASLLLGNGQTTEGTRLAVERLGRARCCPVRFAARWGEFALQAGDRTLRGEAMPAGVDIGRVLTAEAVVDAAREPGFDAVDALARLDAAAHAPPVGLVRFTVMAAAGAAALGIIFGARDGPTTGMIAASAGAGAMLRRLMSHGSGNPVLQPFAAALLAGMAGGVAMRCGLPVADRLVIVCPCMVLVPGPHFLNGGLDLMRARIPIGAGRIALALIIVSAICGGMLVGVAATGTAFPQAGAAASVPLRVDVLAAGVAVAAYSTFFNMPWRLTPVPIGVGMAAHALRWELLAHGASLQAGAFGATLLAGAVIAPLAHGTRLPFGASAFSAVVSLIPGVLMFDATSALVNTIDPAGEANPTLLLSALSDAASALILLLVMTAGLVMPKMAFDAVWARHDRRKPGP